MSLFFMTLMDDEDEKEYITNLYRQYYPLMKKKAYSIIRDNGVVDDLIQDAFLKLIPKIPLLRSLSCYKTTSYIVYTLKHVCLDYIRKMKRRSQRAFSGLTDDVANQIPDLQAATEENYIQHEEFEALELALFKLSERDQSLLYFKYNMEMSDQEIAGLLDIPAQHVRQYVARARRRAFQILSEGDRNNVKEK